MHRAPALSMGRDGLALWQRPNITRISDIRPFQRVALWRRTLFLARFPPGIRHSNSAADALHGTIPWKELLADAIGYARDGIPVSLHQEVRGPIDFALDDKDFGNIQRFPQTRKAFCHPDGRPLRRGEVMRQQDLAQTLEQIAREGADAFYKGDIAKRLVTTLKPEGGVFTTEDFSAYQAELGRADFSRVQRPRCLQSSAQQPGHGALEILNILNNFDIASIEDGSTEFFHLMAEATKAAFADRDEWLTDPKFLEIPLDRLLSAEHGREQAERIRAAGKAAFSNPAVQGGDTVWIGVVDKAGNAVSLIQSICDGFGSGLVVGDTGELMQNRGKYFKLDSTSPNRLEPRKTVFPHVGRGNDVPRKFARACLRFNGRRRPAAKFDSSCRADHRSRSRSPRGHRSAALAAGPYAGSLATRVATQP